MFDPTKLAISDKQQGLVISMAALATGLSACYYLWSPSKNSADDNTTGKNVYREVPTAGSSIPYFGHLFSLGEIPGRTVTKWNQELGPMIQLNMGSQVWYVINDPMLAHEIFVTKGAVTSDRPIHTFFDYYTHGGRGISFANGSKTWKKSRTAALAVLAPQRVNDLTDVSLYEADNLVEQLLERTALYGHVDPSTILQAASLNVVLLTCFGKRVESVEDPLFKDIMNFVIPTVKHAGSEGSLSQFLPIFGLVDALVGKKRVFADFVSKVRDPLFARLIKDALSGDKDCYVKRFEEYDLDETDLIVIMSDFLAAGSDTISVTISWLFVILVSRPDIQQKLRNEVDAFVKVHKRLPTFEERNQMPYLIAVQKESLRFRSITYFGIPHRANKDIVVRDYLIPKDTVLVPNMIGMHMNEDIYDEPYVFNPDRFLGNTGTMFSSANGNIAKRDQYNFGWGRRICPGIHLAEVEMFHMCTRIFANCVITGSLDENGNEVLIDMDAASNCGIVLTPSPYKARFIPRTDSPLRSL
ncbi:cytochrome P450 [Absidia repens]|uniref:Cytochrome P450 n=1 Tax=Absidia repens TaxID=90262 RepID=A0A1X2ICU1_9FUNG|nr:cytochrome P450 [Absidia repens]